MRFRGDSLPTHSRAIQPRSARSFHRLNVERASMRTTGLRSHTSTLVNRNAKCEASHLSLRHNGFFLSTGLFRSYSEWVAICCDPSTTGYFESKLWSVVYSNASRGKRRQPGLTVSVPSAIDNSPQPDSPTEYYARQRRRTWTRLLKKIYEVDPLTCPLWK